MASSPRVLLAIIASLSLSTTAQIGCSAPGADVDVGYNENGLGGRCHGYGYGYGDYGYGEYGYDGYGYGYTDCYGYGYDEGSLEASSHGPGRE